MPSTPECPRCDLHRSFELHSRAADAHEPSTPARANMSEVCREAVESALDNRLTWARHMDVNSVIHLVDDDPAVLRSVAGVLRARGFVVQTYGGPCEFLQALERGIGGCLVTDVRMPNMSGLELVAKMHELGLALPTIFMTAHADPMLMVEISKRDFVDLLEKPFTGDTLINAVRKASALKGG
jgi:CheY-like chemotaxis protein